MKQPASNPLEGFIKPPGLMRPRSTIVHDDVPPYS
jgi:hypothetical protein